METAKDAMLRAFDRLFDRAARKLKVECSEEEKAEAKRQFSDRFGALLDGLSNVPLGQMPDEVLSGMEGAIDQLSPSEVVGLLASIPLAHKGQEIMRALAFRAAEQRLLDHLIQQADERFGGN
jgi:hypothetical protein